MTAPLTSLSHGAGRGCKLSAADLRPIVASLPARPTRACSWPRTRPTTPESCS